MAKTAKLLFIFLFFYISFFFSFGLTTRKEYRKVSYDKYHISWSHIRILHDEYGRVVHRPYNSYISSIYNLMETPLSSPCQLRLGV